jgi:hypothetical protein
VAFIIKDIPQQGGGWFKPAEHIDAVAFLVEVSTFERQRPTPNGPKDSALCDVSIFPDEDALAAGKPLVIKGTRVEQTVLARDLADLVGAATIVSVVQIPAKKPGQHPAWVWRTTSQAVKDQVITFANKREADIAAALDSAPGFD